jgi:hypothetical protein
MVLAVSLVPIEVGVRLRAALCAADIRVRPLGESSEALPDANLELSILALLVSMDGRVQLASSGIGLADELDGRDCGDGGPSCEIFCTLLGGVMPVSQRKDDRG